MAAIFISKIDMEKVKAGTAKEIRIFKEEDLHHHFGDKPMESAVEVEITEK